MRPQIPGILRLNHRPLPQTIMTRIKRAKLFVFLRSHRHELFDNAFRGAVLPGQQPPILTIRAQFRRVSPNLPSKWPFLRRKVRP